MRIICTGGRDYEDGAMVFDLLDRLKPSEVFVGDCSTGLDRLVWMWCEASKVPVRVFEAKWDEHGRKAGPIRNAEMVDADDQDALVIAFPGGRGTEHTVTYAKSKNRIVLRVES